MAIFAERYKVESSRLKDWDYSSPGIYFVTICTLNMNPFFGKIIDGRMELSKRGLYVDKNIKLIEEKFSYIYLENYIIMPNHVHLLLKIIENDNKRIFGCFKDLIKEKNGNEIEKQNDIGEMSRDGINAVSTNKNGSIIKKHNQMRENGLPRIIQWIKGKSTFEIRKELNTFFAWQTRYYDEIIMDNSRYVIVKNYIKNNLINWEKDKLYKNK